MQALHLRCAFLHHQHTAGRAQIRRFRRVGEDAFNHCDVTACKDPFRLNADTGAQVVVHFHIPMSTAIRLRSDGPQKMQVVCVVREELFALTSIEGAERVFIEVPAFGLKSLLSVIPTTRRGQ